MTTTYAHIYGGTAADVGPFTFEGFTQWIESQESVPAPNVMAGYLDRAPMNMKILDLFGDDREILVYKTSPSEVTLTVINR